MDRSSLLACSHKTSSKDTPSTSVEEGSSHEPSIKRTKSPPDNKEATYSFGLSYLREEYVKQGLNENTVELLLSSWKQGTKNQYNIYFKKYLKFCEENNIPVEDINVKNTLNFLSYLYENKLSYSSINCARSAISALSGEKNIGNDQRIKKLMRGIFINNPALPRYSVTWDPDIMLDFLKTLHPCQSLSLLQLSRKVAVLILLLSGRRGQEIVNIDVRNVRFIKNEVKITSKELTKTSKINFHPTEIVLKQYEDEKLCIFRYLAYYIQITKEFRGSNGPFQLFLTTTAPHYPISRDTLSRWVKDSMKAAKIDTSIFHPHSLRSASTSKASKTLSISTIKKCVGWKSSSTFLKFYRKEIGFKESNQAQIQEAVLPQEGDIKVQLKTLN